MTAAALEKEKEIQRARAINEGKPEKMADKIVEGRMSKFYEEVCLYEQPFVKENTITIDQLIKTKDRQTGREHLGFPIRALQSRRRIPDQPEARLLRAVRPARVSQR